MASLASNARAAFRQLARLSADDRRRIVHAMADGIEQNHQPIIDANAHDLDAASKAGLSGAMIDRLRLDAKRIAAMVEGVHQVADLPDMLGKRISRYENPRGMAIERVRVPLGVVLMIYESRPNVTADAAALCFKAGNAVILRGGSEAVNSNRAIAEAMLHAAGEAGMPAHAIQLVPTTDRAAVRELLQLEGFIDLVIPRGGEGLIRAVAESSRIPVMKHYKGVCHVYVDRAADLDMAMAIAVNAKCQRPGVCNAMETLLVHEDVADAFLPRVGEALREWGVEIRGDERVCNLIAGARPASEDDWEAEYLDLILAVRVVRDLDEAITHIEKYGSRHTDAIVTEDEDAAQRFLHEVDSASVFVNLSTRFSDGSEFGLGAEIGISTDKLHARGPCGIEALTTYKYVSRGTGQVRE
jgi:glutamate-5-semialdehyde dehydrogenase